MAQIPVHEPTICNTKSVREPQESTFLIVRTIQVEKT